MLTLYDAAMADVAARTLPNKRAYAQRHGYELIVETETRDESRPTSWSKLAALQAHLDRFDWIFWNDIDALFLDPARRLESYVDLTRDAVFPTDVGPTVGFPGRASGEPRLHASHFFLRRTAWSHEFLQRVDRQRQFIEHSWWEQRAMMYVLEHHPADCRHVRLLAPGELKGGADDDDASFVVHFGGKHKLERIEQFLRHHPRVQNDQAATADLARNVWILRNPARFAGPVRLANNRVTPIELEELTTHNRTPPIARWRQSADAPFAWELTWHDGARETLQQRPFGAWRSTEGTELIPHRAQLLSNLVRQRSAPICAVEVGIFSGVTSALLLQQLPNITLYMVDRWQAGQVDQRWRQSGDPHALLDQASLDERLTQAKHRTEFAALRRVILVADQARAARLIPDTVDLVFLDADHSRQGTREAIETWWPKLGTTGILAGHDYDHIRYPGVAEAVLEFAHSHDLRVHRGADSLWYYART